MIKRPLKPCAGILLALLLCLPPAAALGAEVELSGSSASVQPGDMVEVAITLSGEDMAVAQGIYTYDPAILSFEEGAGGVSDGYLNLVSAQKGGTDTLRATITFEAVGPGEARVDVQIEKVLDYDGEEQDGDAADVTIAVAAPQATPTPTPINYAAEGVPAQNVSGGTDPLYIWRTLENVTIPSLYSETTVEYHGETVAAATVQDSDAPMLLYLSDASGQTGGYYIYDGAADTLYPYMTVSSVSQSYIILEPDGSVALPAGFSETTLVIDEREYKAWKSGDTEAEVYLLYARNADGEVGYYLYNPADESLQRYSVLPPAGPTPTLAPAAPTPAPTAAPSAAPDVPGQNGERDVTLSKTAFWAICGGLGLLVCLVLLLLILRSAEKRRRRRRAAERRARRELQRRAQEMEE